jgi:hypothetical protein
MMFLLLLASLLLLGVPVVDFVPPVATSLLLLPSLLLVVARISADLEVYYFSWCPYVL